MGLFANVPFVVAPGMGINALFVKFAVDINYGWRASLGVSLLMGIVSLIIAVNF
jgi:AGZA family xanthine/uracil permease-like MFS transporter